MSKPDPRKNMETPWRDKERLQRLAKECESKIEMGERLDVGRRTIEKWMNRLGVEMPDPPWRCESTLREAYNRLGNQKEVASEMDAHPGTINRWMKKHGIETKKRHPGRDIYDAEKMRQYYEEEKSVRGVAERLQGNPSQGAVIKWLDKHGVETSHDHATRGERVLVECDNSGSEKEVYESTIRGNSWYCSLKCMGEGYEKERTPERPYRGGWGSAREEARSRDNEECQVCGSQSNLHVHHIIRVVEFKSHKEAHDLDNLVTVCRSCHPILERLSEEEQRELIQ